MGENPFTLMFYYKFSCNHCQDERILESKSVVDEVLKAGYHQCGLCDKRTATDPANIFQDDKPEPTDYYCDDRAFNGHDKNDLPTAEEMSVVGEDLEDLEPWEMRIIDEFEASDDFSYDHKACYEDALEHLKSHKFGWVKFGVWAFQFKLKRLYCDHYKTWKSFCEKELHLSNWYVDKIIKACRVVKDLICAGFTVLPQNEYQARFLTKFWGDELIDNWSMVVEGVPPHLITSELIKSKFEVREPKEEKWLKVNSNLWETFQYKARSQGLDPNQLMEEYLTNWDSKDEEESPDELDDDETEEVPIDKVEAWQQDLEDLMTKNESTFSWFTKLIFWSLFNGKEIQVSGVP